MVQKAVTVVVVLLMLGLFVGFSAKHNPQDDLGLFEVPERASSQEISKELSRVIDNFDAVDRTAASAASQCAKLEMAMSEIQKSIDTNQKINTEAITKLVSATVDEKVAAKIEEKVKSEYDDEYDCATKFAEIEAKIETMQKWIDAHDAKAKAAMTSSGGSSGSYKPQANYGSTGSKAVTTETTVTTKTESVPVPVAPVPAAPRNKVQFNYVQPRCVQMPDGSISCDESLDYMPRVSVGVQRQGLLRTRAPLRKALGL